MLDKIFIIMMVEIPPFSFAPGAVKGCRGGPWRGPERRTCTNVAVSQVVKNVLKLLEPNLLYMFEQSLFSSWKSQRTGALSVSRNFFQPPKSVRPTSEHQSAVWLVGDVLYMARPRLVQPRARRTLACAM